jgi:hypothetical protein
MERSIMLLVEVFSPHNASERLLITECGVQKVPDLVGGLQTIR